MLAVADLEALVQLREEASRWRFDKIRVQVASDLLGHRFTVLRWQKRYFSKHD